MLCISIHGQGSKPYLKFEMEPYYSYRHRSVTFSIDLDIFDFKILLRDREFKDDLGLYLVLSLFASNGDFVWRSRQACLQIYPHFRCKQAILAIGEQVYLGEKQRKHCFDFPLDTLERDVLWNDEDLELTLAENVLKYLPISEELCMQVDDGGA